jgi:hypothetical protein
LKLGRILLVLAMVLVACGDDDGTGTTGASTTGPGEGGSAASGDTVDGGESGPGLVIEGGCSELWPVASVQAVLGAEFELIQESPDGAACSYAALPASLTLNYRIGDRTDFELAESGVSLAGATSQEVDVCDDGFTAELAGDLFTLEALDEDGGYVFNATGTGVEEPLEKAMLLLQAACDEVSP